MTAMPMMSESAPVLLEECADGVLRLTLNRPQARKTRAVAPEAALEMLRTGELIEAQRAGAIGLGNRVAPRAGLRDVVDSLAHEIAGKSALTVAIGKEAFYRQAELDLAAAYRYAAEIMTTNMLARDAGEGIDAFLAKRAPVWQDRWGSLGGSRALSPRLSARHPGGRGHHPR